MTSELSSHISMDDLFNIEEIVYTYPASLDEYWYDPNEFTQYNHETYTIGDDGVTCEYSTSIFKKDRFVRDVDTAYDSESIETDKLTFDYALIQINGAIDSARRHKTDYLEVTYK